MYIEELVRPFDVGWGQGSLLLTLALTQTQIVCPLIYFSNI